MAPRHNNRLNVLIVGAGPTGLALALQLQALGVPFRIIDRQLDRARESRALAVQPRTLELLRTVGVADELVERGNDAVKLQMHVGARVARLRLFDIGLEYTAYPFLLFVSQAVTEEVMNDRLVAADVKVERGMELVAISPGDEEAACTLQRQDGETERVRASYLVGCDGAHSTVRDLAGIPFEGAAYPQTFALADLDVDGGLDSETVHAFLRPTGMLLFFPLEHPAPWRMIAMGPRAVARAGEEPRAPSLEDLQRITDAYTPNLRLRDPVWLSYFRIHHRQAVSYRRGRVFVAGAAAHVHSPAGAQGMNTGIQDSWNLGWKLALVAKDVTDQTLLDSYEAERLPIGRFVVRFTDRAFLVATSTNRLVRLIRLQVVPRLAPLLLRVKRGRAAAFRTVAQLGLNYRQSTIVEEGEPPLRRGPKAGDRLPDLRLVQDGEEIWLYEVLDPARFHLLLCGPPDEWEAVRIANLRERYEHVVVVHWMAREGGPGVLLDKAGLALRRLGIERLGLYLVRPDGYVAYRSAGESPAGLECYLRRWIRCPDQPKA